MPVRFLLHAVVLASLVAPAAAQDPVPNPGWERVQALAAGTDLEVRTSHGKQHCHLLAANETQLNCKQASYARDEVQRVRLERRSSSIARGLLIGTGVGVGVGLAAGAAAGPGVWTSRSKGAGVGAAIFGVAGR
jgi:hypothetical protein